MPYSSKQVPEGSVLLVPPTGRTSDTSNIINPAIPELSDKAYQILSRTPLQSAHRTSKFPESVPRSPALFLSHKTNSAPINLKARKLQIQTERHESAASISL
uniref:Uncharacterized protein n=1 Tax=Spironucleus salmonicida TaxID=348837 RepID=V6LCX0_9EUKA|eukprot:EST42330.1 Hypothetical protein SS50377_18118 [Spironucleus salmonicida]